VRTSFTTSLTLLCLLASCSLERLPLSCEADADCPDGYRCDALGHRCIRWVEPDHEDASVAEAGARDQRTDSASLDGSADAATGNDVATFPDAVTLLDAARADLLTLDTAVSAPDVCVPSCDGRCGGGGDGCGGTCNGACPLGEWCPGTTCEACDSSQHCGRSGEACVDCLTLVTNHACVDGRCGCTSAPDHCVSGEACFGYQCVCAPDCAGRCGGSDGCGGSCTGSCSGGEWCDGVDCHVCEADDDLHCGSSCADCTQNVNDRFCINGSCGCRNDSDCDVGLWCSLNHCVACDQPSHCGLVCESCLGPPLDPFGHACVNAECGCWDNSDCDYGVRCVLNRCSQLEPAIDAWYGTDQSCNRIDVSYPQQGFGQSHWANVHVYDWETGVHLGPMSGYHQLNACNLYFGGDETWPDSYYRFHGTRAEFRQRGLPRYVKFRFVSDSSSAYSGECGRVDLGQ